MAALTSARDNAFFVPNSRSKPEAEAKLTHDATIALTILHVYALFSQLILIFEEFISVF